MTARLSDSATVACWDFCTPEVYAAAKERARYVAGKYRVNHEDLLHDALLNMAVRPDTTRDIDEALLVTRVEQELIQIARPGAKRQAREQSWEALLEGDNSWPS